MREKNKKKQSGNTPTVSVVIPTIGRGTHLVGTVSHLLQSDHRDFEVVVVDQTKKPEAAILLYMKKNRDRVRYLRIDQVGLPNARNVGIDAAAGEIILFVDDDVIPDARLISSHAHAYTQSDIGGVAGRVIAHEGEPKRPVSSPRAIAKIGRLGLSIRDNFDATVSTAAHHAKGCNMSFRKDALQGAGGFDTRFGGTAHMEETDMAVRIRRLGYRMVFEPSASLVHLLEPTGGCRPKNMREWFYWYWHNYCLFYRKNFSRLLFLLFALYFFLKLPLSAVKWKERRVIRWGCRGFFDGRKAGIVP
jgi:GT2 family glycosyltransferase